MIAASKPTEKEIMIKVLLNLLAGREAEMANGVLRWRRWRESAGGGCC